MGLWALLAVTDAPSDAVPVPVEEQDHVTCWLPVTAGRVKLDGVGPVDDSP